MTWFDLYRTRGCRAACALSLAWAVAVQARPEAPSTARPPAPTPAPAAPLAASDGATLDALVGRLQAAWAARDVTAYLGLWRFASDEAREREADFAREYFSAGDTRLIVERPPAWPARARQRLMVRTFAHSEPRAKVEQWRLVLEQDAQGWHLSAREATGRLDGLVHLSLDPGGYLAAGKVLQLPDCELRFLSGTLFTSPANVGPTLLVFVGEAELRFQPGPATEREQLRQFWGAPELVERVNTLMVRLHPADLHRLLKPADWQPDPEADRRLPVARRFFDQQAASAFVLDVNLPGSPWWVLPSLGDTLLVFDSRKGVLSYTVSTGQPESLSLFDRGRRRQVCLYALPGRSVRHSEDDQREVDALHHDVRVRLEPQQGDLQGEAVLRLRQLRPATSVRLRLRESLRVRSITSAEGGTHLFFRVRNQDSVVVSLGPLAESSEYSLTVVYGGPLDPDEWFDEAQVPNRDRAFRFDEEETFFEPVRLFSNRALWYPQPAENDYASADLSIDVPAGYLAVGPGERTGLTRADGRVVSRFHLREPGKYLAVAVGRLQLAGERQAGSVRLNAYSSALRRGTSDSLLTRAQDIMAFYTGLFGPCPYASINLVAFDADTPGGHSPPGLVALSFRSVLRRTALRDDPASFDDVPGFFLAHELAHQWWGQGVAGENYHERWLSEGAAQYAAALWTRHAHGEVVFQGVLRRLSRWARRMNAQGPIDLGYRLGHLAQDPQIYRAIVYNKGAYVLHMLRELVGASAFDTALRAFQAAHRYGKAGTDDLRAALERASGQDLADYFEAWVRGTQLPRLRLHWRADKHDARRTHLRVEAKGLPGPVPLELTLVGAGAKQAERVTLPAAGGEFEFQTPFRPTRIQLNSNQGLLADIE